jgi:hypothetical protein
MLQVEVEDEDFEFRMRMLTVLYSDHSARKLVEKAVKSDCLDFVNFIMEYNWSTVGWFYNGEDLVGVTLSSSSK